MRPAFIILLLSFLVPTPAIAQDFPVDTSRLSMELVAGHPAYFNGDYEQLRSDLIDAMLADRTSPLLPVAARQLHAVEILCASEFPPHRLAELIEGIQHGETSGVLRLLYGMQLNRTRFRDVRSLASEDLYAPHFTHWRVLRNWGDAGHPSPLFDGSLPPNPYHAELEDPADGTVRRWEPLLRRHSSNQVEPSAGNSAPSGSTYSAIWLKAEPQLGTLSLLADEAFRAWWNGMPVFEHHRRDYTELQSLHEALVHVQEGWNLLLIQHASEDDLYLGGQLLSRHGAEIPVTEWREGMELAPPLDRQPPPMETLEIDPWRPTPDGNWSEIMKLLLALQEEREDLGLAVAEPLELTPHQQAAWLHWRHELVSEAYHLPESIVRQRLLELEARIAELGLGDVRVEMAAARRMFEEDRLEHALTATRELAQKAPRFYEPRQLECEVLLELDPTGTLALPSLISMTEDFPLLDWAWEQRMLLAEEMDHRGLALELARQRSRITSSGAMDLIDLLLEGPVEQLDEAAEMLTRIRMERPDEKRLDSRERRLARRLGEQGLALQALRDEAASHPSDLSRLEDLARALMRANQLEEAKAVLRRIQQLAPSHGISRRTLAVLGEFDRAEEFFSAFDVDTETMLARKEELDSSTSVAMLLDSGMVYLLPDGGYIYRVHNLDVALDRRGTEMLHERGVAGTPLSLRVITTDGDVLEPHQVDDTWVMPSLDPGDVIESVYDRYARGAPGVVPEPGNWRFASFDLPFLLSRWVLFVPDGLDGSLREHGFDGLHEVVDWPGGKVHVFTREHDLLFEPEVLMPSELEILPWVAYGEDQPLEWSALQWREYFHWQSALTADLELELRQFLAEMDLPADNRGRAEAIFQQVEARTLDFDSDGDANDVWLLRRGNPTFLLSALYRLAGVQHEWALLESSAPELNEDPLQPFQDGSRFQLPCLRIAQVDEEPTWMLLMAKGAPFGDLAPSLLGAEALVLEPEGYRLEEISREGLDDLWDRDLSIAYRLGEDTTAMVSGIIEIGGMQGGSLREAISQLPPQEVDQALRQLGAQMVKGLDLNTARLVDLDVPGAPLKIEYEGTVPGFIQRSGDRFGARLRIPELGLAESLGPTDRQYDFVLRAAQGVRTRIQLDCGDSWAYEYGPTAASEHREGFHYDFTVEGDERHLVVERILRVRGARVPAVDFAEFLDHMRHLENQEKRAVQLMEVLPEREEEPLETPVEPTSPEQEPTSPEQDQQEAQQ